jgi:hypothetical protein
MAFRFSLSVFFLALSIVAIAQQVQVSSIPNWVTTIRNIEPSLDMEPGDGGMTYLLVDNQLNVLTEEQFVHFAMEITNAEGIESASDISIVYDPTFQRLTFHAVNVIRRGESIDKLKDHQISTIQRESGMERNLYDGSLTAIINLKDVRVGDIVEYSYTIKGQNPIYKGHIYKRIYFQHSVSVQRIFQRIITNAPIQFKYFNEAPKPIISSSTGRFIYLWDIDDPETILYDSNVPAWYNPFQMVQFSTFDSWVEVVDWALPLYDVPKGSFQGLKEIEVSVTDNENKLLPILKIIRFVQDEVRYLGFESGTGAYKPNHPQEVLNHRYGDCKDKSLLLVALLSELGVKAYPVYVSSSEGYALDNYLPTPLAFDHVVTLIEYDGEEYFVDPTISFQGGDLAHIAFPDYGYGLIIKRGNGALKRLPTSLRAKTLCKELFEINDFSGHASFTVRTEYSGSVADSQRSFLLSNGHDAIQKEYLNFYSILFPEIKSTKAIEVLDDNRFSDNKLIVEEYYEIENLWQKDPDSELIYFETYPLILDSYTDLPKSASRTMPYYMGEPKEIIQETTLVMPETWTAEATIESVSGDGFSYMNTVTNYHKTINVTHHYEVSKSYQEPYLVDELLSKHTEIRNNFSFSISYNKSLEGFKISWFAIVLTIISLLVGAWFARRLFYNYDPAPWKYAENFPIGSWLVLIAIGVAISPFRILYELLVDLEYYNQNTWLGLMQSGSSFIQNLILGFLLMLQLIVNWLLFVYVILLAFLFFTRRTSVPKLMLIYLIANFAIPLLDHVLFYIAAPNLFNGLFTEELFLELAAPLLGSAVWIPYFLMSERVKSTFCKTLGHQEDATST